MTQAPEYRLVPVEPTEAMMDAMEACSDDWPRTTWRQAWGAAIAAAPHTAAPAADRAVSELVECTHELLSLIRRNAPELSGKAMGRAEAAIDALARSTDAPSERVQMMREWGRESAERYDAKYGIATPPAAATVIQHEDGEVSIALPAEQKRVANVVRSQPAAATSTPCASGEAHALAEEVKTAWGRQDPKRLWRAVEALEALAATQAPAVPATKPAVTIRVKLDPESGEYLSVDSRTPTAGNTEDARSMGAVSDTQMLDFLARLGDFSAGSVPSIPHDYEVRTEDDRVFKGESLRGCIRAALTQAASTGGAAS